jgi:ABC-type dipeptide/oligopeptide/nickel transport system permease subunit
MSDTTSFNAWNRFLRNPLSLSGMIIILIALMAAILGYLIIPDKSPNANEQHIEIAARKPGFRVHVLKVCKNEHMEDCGLVKRMMFGQRNRFQLIPFNEMSMIKDSVVVADFNEGLSGIDFMRSFHLADVIYPLDPGNKQVHCRDGIISFTDIDGLLHQKRIEDLQQSVIEEHVVERRFLLGTDRFGRDFYSRLLLGTRVSLSVGFISVSISLLIGLILGSMAGYFRGRTDDIIMWFINVVWSIPTLLLVIAITLALGKGFWQVFVAVGLTMWVEVARVVRGQVLGIREKEFIQAAKSLGYSSVRILFRHVLPNVISPVIIISAANFASAILMEAGLSFLGIGVQPPIPSWGTMIKDHYGFIIVDKAYLAFLPGLAIMLMVLSFTMVGNGLRDALDVRRK